MATVVNRSRFSVTVARRADLARTFPYNAEKKALAYVAKLRAQGHQPKLSQLNDRFEVKIRQKTGKSQNITVGSYDEAELVVNQIEGERKRGLFVDYPEGWKVSCAVTCARRRPATRATRPRPTASTACWKTRGRRARISPRCSPPTAIRTRASPRSASAAPSATPCARRFPR